MEKETSVLARFGEHNYRAGHVVEVGCEGQHPGEVFVETYMFPQQRVWVAEKDCARRPLSVLKELGLA